MNEDMNTEPRVHNIGSRTMTQGEWERQSGYKPEALADTRRPPVLETKRRKKGEPIGRPTIYDPKTKQTYKKYSKEHYASEYSKPKQIPATNIPLTDREFDNMYFGLKGNPFNINPLTETARSKFGREKLFEDMFYVPYSDKDKLSDEDKKEWNSVKRNYDKNIYENAKERKSQGIKQYQMIKGYNSDQRKAYDRYRKEQEAKRLTANQRIRFNQDVFDYVAIQRKDNPHVNPEFQKFKDNLNEINYRSKIDPNFKPDPRVMVKARHARDKKGKTFTVYKNWQGVYFKDEKGNEPFMKPGTKK